MIQFKHLERFYPLAKEKFFYVLRDINLEVNEGDFVSIMGPSGAGKFSLLHVIGMHDHASRNFRRGVDLRFAAAARTRTSNSA